MAIDINMMKGASNILGKLLESQIKEVEKIGKQQVQEAVQQGVPIENIATQLQAANEKPEVGLAPLAEQQKVSQALAGQSPQQEPQVSIGQPGIAPNQTAQIQPQQQDSVPPLRQILGGLIRQTGESRQRDLQNVLLEQEIRGEKKLQKGEMDKIALELGSKLQQIANKPEDALTPKESADFNLLLDGADSTVNISNLLETNVTKQLFAQGIPDFLKSQQAKLLQSNIERAIQSKTRIETGAALAPKELKSTAKRFMPQKGDTLETSLTRLKPLNDFFQGAINTADPRGVHRKRVGRGGQSQGQILTATNPQTGQKIKSIDGGKTWQTN